MKPDDLRSISAEEAVLGSILIDPTAYAAVAPLLSADDFSPKNSPVYEAIQAAASNGGVDLLTIQDHLARRDKLVQVGGTAYLAELINATPSAYQAEQYAAIVRDYAYRRGLVQAASEVARAAYDLDADQDQIQARAEGAVLDARRSNGHKRSEPSTLSGDLYEHWHNVWERGGLYGLPTGIEPLDGALGGLEAGVYILAGRPSVGKSAVALQIMCGLAAQRKRCVIFVIEASARQTWERIATSVARVELKAIKEGRAFPEEQHRLMDTLACISDWPITIFDQSTLRPGDVLAGVRQVQVEHGDVAAVFVDGLWLMTPTKEHENRTQNVGSISREMKQVQRELNIPLVMMHQLNRGVENRADKRPVLADLRDTGDVEQDTDVVLMLYRAGQYDPHAEDAQVMEIWIRKNRLGGPSNECVKMFWQGKYMWLDKLAYGNVNLQ